MRSIINDYFDHIYLINLDKRKDRLKQADAELKKYNIEYERFPAVDGNTVKIKELEELSVGLRGLHITHVNIFKDAKKNNYKNFLLFEDDITIIDDFEVKFMKRINDLPSDWNLLYLGGNFLFRMGTFKCISNPSLININEENYKVLDYELFKSAWTQTAHAVAFNSNIYDFLLNTITTNFKPVDGIYTSLQTTYINAYAYIPSLVKQRPSFSDIENRFVDYEESKLNNF